MRRRDLRQPGAVIGRQTIAPRDPRPWLGRFQFGNVIGRQTIAPRDPLPRLDPARSVSVGRDICRPALCDGRPAIARQAGPSSGAGPGLAWDVRHFGAPVRRHLGALVRDLR